MPATLNGEAVEGTGSRPQGVWCFSLLVSFLKLSSVRKTKLKGNVGLQ